MMITSYPFLRISQLYNIPYNVVLNAAEYNRCMGQTGRGPAIDNFCKECWNGLYEYVRGEIMSVNAQMTAIQAGVWPMKDRHFLDRP